MKRTTLTAGAFIFLGVVIQGCSSNPYKVQKVETNLENKETVTKDQVIGVKSDQTLVVQEKTDLRERLRDLQNEVMQLEDKVYGMRKYDSLGLYGDLRNWPQNNTAARVSWYGPSLWIAFLTKKKTISSVKTNKTIWSVSLKSS